MQDVAVIFNSGSSSLKFTVFPAEEQTGSNPLLHGELEDNGDHTCFSCIVHEKQVVTSETWPETGLHAFDRLFAWLRQYSAGTRAVAAGHRIVHGGPEFSAPVVVTPDVLAKLQDLTPFDPLHQGATLAPVQAIAARRPDILQIACFDTAFHASMPEVARLIPVPRQYAEKGVRRYGFHGISYSYISRTLMAEDPKLMAGKVIVAHLGSGASLCAMENGKSIDTTMGFSVLDGLVMGTRCGEIDPGVLLYMIREEKADWDTLVETLYHRSGLLGLSDLSPDMRRLRVASADCTDPDQKKKIREALDVFTYRVTEKAGALAAVMGGLNGIVFTAGIGEHDAALRSDICAKFAWAGLVIDEAANQRNDRVISTPESTICVRVEPTDEEAEIFRHVRSFLAEKATPVAD